MLSQVLQRRLSFDISTFIQKCLLICNNFSNCRKIVNGHPEAVSVSSALKGKGKNDTHQWCTYFFGSASQVTARHYIICLPFASYDWICVDVWGWDFCLHIECHNNKRWFCDMVPHDILIVYMSLIFCLFSVAKMALLPMSVVVVVLFRERRLQQENQSLLWKHMFTQWAQQPGHHQEHNQKQALQCPAYHKNLTLNILCHFFFGVLVSSSCCMLCLLLSWMFGRGKKSVEVCIVVSSSDDVRNSITHNCAGI